MSSDSPAVLTMSLRNRKVPAAASKKKNAVAAKKKVGRPKKTSWAGDGADVESAVDSGLTCRLCTQHFSSIEACAAHIVTAHLPSLQLCARCSRAFTCPAQLAAHAALHRRRGTAHSCAHCPVHFASPILLERHEARRHAAAAPGAVLARHLPHLSALLRMNFAQYVRLARRGRRLGCGACEYSTHEPALYREHALRCTGATHVCDRCSNVYCARRSLRNHFLKNSKCREPDYMPSLLQQRRVRSIACRKCRSKFADRVAYQSHWDTCCSSNECTKCDKQFESLYEFQAHNAAHHKESLKIRTCGYCRMEFISLKSLERHVKKHERYACLRCGKMFRTPKPLLYHIKCSHSDVEPYKCVPCARAFRDGLQFKLHVQAHGGGGCIKFDDDHYVTYTERAPAAAAEGGGEGVEGGDSGEGHESGKRGEGGEIGKGGVVGEIGKGGEGGEIGEGGDVGEGGERGKGVEEGEIGKGDAGGERGKGDERGEIGKSGEPGEGGEGGEWSEEEAEQVVKRGRGRPRKRPESPPRARRRAAAVAEKTYRCAVCGKRTGTLDSFNKHVNLHFRMGAKQCGRCAKIFRSRALLQRHEESAHRDAPPGTPLHTFLKERAARKMAALAAQRRAASVAAARDTPPAPPLPFRLRMRRVAPPTYDALRAAAGLRADGAGAVTVTPRPGPLPECGVGGLTAQKYVETFQPEPDEEERPPAHSGPVRRVTNNKSLKVRSVSSRELHKGFTIRMRRFRETKVCAGAGLAWPTPYRAERAPRAHVTVGIADAAAVARRARLDYGAPPPAQPSGDIYDADYFETDDHSVAQIEVLSTPAPATTDATTATARRRTYMLELTDSDPSTAEMERKLAAVCAGLDAPASALHIGQLTTRAPYYKIINVRKAQQRRERQRTQLDVRRRFEQVKIGAAKMVPVNPLEHLLRRAREGLERAAAAQGEAVPATAGQNITITPLDVAQQ